MSRRLLAVLLMALAGVAAGCGGGGEPTVAEYEQTVITARNRTDYALERITRAQSMDELLNRMDEAEVVIDRSADELEEGGAPEIFVEENARLVTSLHGLANDVGLTAEQVRLPGFENFLSGARGLSYENWDKVNRALASLVGDGIDVQLLGRH
jgi:hypothetical protein